jgi:transcription elongation factor Elf1
MTKKKTEEQKAQTKLAPRLVVGECPACGKPDVVGEGVEVDGPRAWQECSCGACGATWTDGYRLTEQVVHGLTPRAVVGE